MVIVVIEVDSYFIRKNYLIVIFHRIGNQSQDFLFIGIFQRGRTCDSGAKFQNEPILPLKPIRISRDIRTGPDKAHVALQNIPKFRKFV